VRVKIVAQLEHDQLTPSGLVPEPRWSHQRHLPQLVKDLSEDQNLTVHFDCRFVAIERSGFLARAHVGKGEKRIPISSIQALRFMAALHRRPRRRAIRTGSVVSVLAGNAAGRRNTAHQAARGATYLRHLDASPRRSRGGHRGADQATRADRTVRTASALVSVEPMTVSMTGIEPAYSAWEVDSEGSSRATVWVPDSGSAEDKRFDNFSEILRARQ
jgi:hypothetical protein